MAMLFAGVALLAALPFTVPGHPFLKPLAQGLESSPRSTAQHLPARGT
ncbi:hypothetical protein [Streptomyces sp. M1013]|nr:hypothetical protein [Streptomyces sp. M1013]